MINTIFYILFFVILGLPIWFLTTSTYRASLPFDSIESISLVKIDYQIRFEIIYFGNGVEQSKLNEINDRFFMEISQGLNQEKGLALSFKGKLRKSNEKEYNLGLTSKTLEGIFKFIWIFTYIFKF